MKKIICLSAVFFSIISFAQKTELVIRRGHANNVFDVAFSPDKKWMTSASEDGSVILWDAQKGRQIKQYQLCKKGNVESVAFSPDGNYIAAAGDDIVVVIDARSTNLLDSFHVENKNSAIIFTPDSKYFISTNWSGYVTVWRSSDRQQVVRFNPYEGMYDTNYKYFSFIRDLGISPDGKTMVLGDDDYGLVEFKIPEEESGWNNILETRTTQKIKIAKLAYTGTGKYLVVLTDDNALLTLDGNTYAVLKKAVSTAYETQYEAFGVATNDDFIYARSGVNKIVKLALPSLALSKVISDTSRISRMFTDKSSGYFYATMNDDANIYQYPTESFKNASVKFTAGTSINKYVAISPDGKLLAINNETIVTIYDVTQSRIVKRLQLSDNFFKFSYELQFDKSGKFLFVNEAQNITQWSTADWKRKRVFAHSEIQVITAFSLSVDGNYLATADNGDDPLLKVWNIATGTLLATKKQEHGIEACAFSNDSKILAAIGGLSPLVFYAVPSFTPLFTGNDQLSGENLLFSSDAKSLFTFKRNAIYKTSISDRSTALVHSEGGEPSEFSFPVTTLSAAPDGKTFLMKGDAASIMRADMATGVPFARMSGQEANVMSVCYSGDGNYYATAGDDGQVILRDKSDSVLCSFFTIRNAPDWIVVTPDGRFDASAEALNSMYFHKATEILPLSSLYEIFYTPQLLPRLLAGEQLARLDVDINDVKQKPLVAITYAEKQRNLDVSDDVPSYQNTTGVAEITVNASAQDDAVDEIRLFQNGKVLNLVTRNLIVEDDKSKTATKKYTISLLPGNNEIRAVALNTQRTESQPDIINVMYNDGAASNTNSIPANNNKTTVIVDKIDKNATLHLVVVGINAYKNPAMSLNYALADATAFKEEVEKDAKTMIANVKTYFITDDAADKTGIIKALQQVQQTAKPQDVFLFYYAGHGVISNKEFYLVPNDVTDIKNVDEALKEHGIAAKDLQQYAINIQAQKQLFILDACQSAAAFADMLSSDGNQQKNIAVVARATGTHWMAASGAQQFANEFSTLGHGAFTYVLLQALHGEAAANKMITVDGLKTYMQNGVPALMKKYNGSQQTPASYGFGNDFPVEIVK